MKSSCAISVILVLAIGALIVQGRKQDCPCGGLGPEKNPCSCSEIVVKAAKLPKPVAYAPPQVIAQAAELREKLAQGLARTTSSLVYAHGHQHQGSGCGCGGGGVNVVDNSGGGVNVVDNSAGGVNVVDNSVGGVNVVDNSVGGVNVVDNSGGGVSVVGGGQTDGSLQLRDLVKGHQKVIVPSFRPIGDICYPLPMHPTTGEMIEKITTVTPAHPGKPKCSCHQRPVPYEYCVKLINGHPVPPEYPVPQPRHPDHSGHTEYHQSGQLDQHSHSSHSDHLGYRSGHLEYGHANSHSGLHSGHNGPQPRTYGGMFEQERIIEEDSSFYRGGMIEEDSAFYRGPGGAMLEEDSAFYRGPGGGMIEEDHTFYRGPGGGAFEEDRTTNFYGSADEDMYYGRHAASSHSHRPMVHGGSGSHGSIVDESDCDSGRTDVQVTPRVPADPVSLALAFKSIHPPHVIYKGNKKMPFVPEDKLSFGHRTLPTEVKTEAKKKDIAEEKLIVVDKPVVELKLTPTKNVVIGSYDEKEEAKLAELEAVEREYIAQEEAPVNPTEPQVTYGELGYVPLGMKPSRPKPSHMSNTGLIIENGSKAPCGPLGLRVPGYVPGTVVVQEFVEKEETFGTEDQGFHGRSQTIGLADDEDSEEEYFGGSDFLSKLRSVAKQRGSGFCPH